MENKELTPLEALKLVAIGQCKGKRKQYIGIIAEALKEHKAMLDDAGKQNYILDRQEEALNTILDFVVDVGVLKDSKSYSEYNHRMCQRFWTDFQDFHQKPAYKAIGENEFNVIKDFLGDF